MGVNIPASFELVKDSDLIGRIAAGREPLETIADQGNYLYAHHRPPIAAFSPHDRGTSYSLSYIVPITPSADGLTYDLHFAVHAVIAGTYTITVSTSQTHGGTYANIYNANRTPAAAQEWFTLDAQAIPAADRFLRVQLSSINTANAVQLQWFAARPSAARDPADATAQAIPAGVQPSGFCRVDGSLLAAAGAPVHVELLNRCRDNALAVIQDRRQAVAAFVTEAPGLRMRTDGAEYSAQIFRLPYHLAGQQRAKVRVHVYAAPGRFSAGHIVVGQVLGANTPAMACDSTARSELLQLQGDRGEIYAVLTVTAGTDCAIHYVVIDWTPGE